LRQPVLTAAGLAAELGATPQGALLIIKRLMAAGILREATGRSSFRAFVV
jgi:predicted transcriptional regulator